ncbi:MAG: hypothetical protein ACPHXW_01860 [Marinobacterium sp.]
MEWLIIVFIMASLIGSVMWVMPSPRQRYQADLRMRARKAGIQVQLVRLELPRAQGEVEGDTINVPAYRFLRQNVERAEKDRWHCWDVLRLETLDQQGLEPGWSWRSEDVTLTGHSLEALNVMLQQLPEDVVGVESTPLHLTLYWHERGEADRLDTLIELSRPLLEQKI